MLKELVKLANNLDSKGLRKEADLIDKVILKISQEVHVDEAGVEWSNMGDADFPMGHVIWSAEGHPQKRLKKGMKPSSRDYNTSPTVTKSNLPKKVEQAEEQEAAEGHMINFEGGYKKLMDALSGSDKN